MTEPFGNTPPALRGPPLTFRFMSCDLDEARPALDRFSYCRTAGAPTAADELAPSRT